ncbi:MAG: DUF4133 domain-containing protein [Cytophagaceae bacterium]|nr:DUF4133 domain-containing protein [Cytophagaceae bacterium]
METCRRDTVRRWVLSLRLKSKYLFIFAGGLLGLFIVFVVLFMVGVNQWACIGFGIISAPTLVYGTFHLNRKYGEHGLMKAQARRSHPRYVINRRSFPDYELLTFISFPENVPYGLPDTSPVL